MIKNKFKIFKTLVIFLCFYFVLFSCKNKSSNKATQIENYHVKKTNIKNIIKVTGEISPQVGAEVKVGSRVSGKVEKLYVKIGDYVKQNQLIAVIEHQDLEHRLKKLQYEYKIKQQELKSLIKEYPLKIKSKKFKIEEIKIKIKFLTKEFNRIKKLFSKKMVSEQEFDNIKKELYSLKKLLVSEEKNLSLLKQEFSDRKKTLNLKLNEIKEDIKIAEVNLSYAYIRAPIDGTISSISTQEGETVSASLNAPVFVDLINLKKLKVVSFIDETDIGKIKIGQKAEIRVLSYPDKIFTGKIKTIYPKATIKNNVVTYKIEIEIDKPHPDFIKPEMTAYIDIILLEKKNVIAIPLKCVKIINGKNYVFLKQGDKYIKKEVKTGIIYKGMIEIKEGLKVGDVIIIKGFNHVHSI